MTRGKRIRNLERQVFGDDDDEKGITPDELEHLCQQEFKQPNPRFRPTTPPPRNLDRLRQRCLRLYAAYKAREKAEALSATDTAAQTDSQSPSSPSTTCCSPVLTGSASDESTTVAKTDNEEPAPSASQSQPAGDPTPAAPTMTQEEREKLDRLFGKGRWSLKKTTPNPARQGMTHNPGRQSYLSIADDQGGSSSQSRLILESGPNRSADHILGAGYTGSGVGRTETERSRRGRCEAEHVGRGGVGEKPFEGFARTGPAPPKTEPIPRIPPHPKEQRQEIARKAAAARWGRTK